MLLIAGGGIFSCSKSRLELTSLSSYDYDTYFNSADGLNQAVIATYATLLHNGLWSREYYFIFDLLGYEAKKTTNMQGDMAQLADYSFGTSQTQIGQLWNSLYRMIFRANVVIDRATVWNPSSTTDQEKAKQYIAEARFLRSYAYFNIVNLWGRAPLYTSYDSTVANNYPSRASVESIWSFIENDLTQAAADLPVSYDAATGLGRATQGAALALLGKSYLYQKKWAQAQATLSQLTAAPYAYALDTNYDNLFSSTNQSSAENIFQVMNAAWTDWGIGNQYYVFGGQETWGGKATHSDRAQEYGFKDWFNVYIPTTTVNSFTYTNPNTGVTYTDPRAAFTFYGNKASGGDTLYCENCTGGKISFPFNEADPQGYYVWRKYEYYEDVASYGGPQSSINGQVIRYADVLLMLAEAYIQQGDTGSIPLGLINQVRSRSGAFTYTSLGDQTNAMTILGRERQLELCGEQSRYFDLIRWGIAKETINAQRAIEPGDGKQPFLDKNVLFPIPDVEKNYNPNVARDIANGWN
ncbi:MAG: RagB/SusD family nutrient uptake outer membrane protein [Siphonobacter sp.]